MPSLALSWLRWHQVVSDCRDSIGFYQIKAPCAQVCCPDSFKNSRGKSLVAMVESKVTLLPPTLVRTVHAPFNAHGSQQVYPCHGTSLGQFDSRKKYSFSSSVISSPSIPFLHTSLESSSLNLLITFFLVSLFWIG